MNKYQVLFLTVLFSFSFTACEFGFDERPEERAAGFVPVENITGVPTGGQPYVAIPLAATVVPANANNKRIEWSIAHAGATGAVLNGSRLTAAAEGTVTVTARIANGLGGNVDYTRNFDILISLTAIYAVQEIYGIPEALPIGDFTYTLNGKITPDNASYRDIVWSVIDNGGTGTTINGNYLAAQRKGTVRVRAAIANGRLTSDYTQDFSIVISRGVVAAGYYRNNNYIDKACYFVAGQRIDLPVSGNPEKSFADGIVYVGDKQFISGYYGNRYNYNLCYWVDGVQKTLPNSSTSNSDYYGYAIISIAAGGGYVYILGMGDSDNWYYWKISASSGEVARTAQLVNFYIQDTKNDNLIVVKNDGSAVIAGRRGYDNANCYWLSDDSKSTIDPVQITALDNNQGFYIQCVGLVGGEVYFAGIVREVNYYPYPFYYRLGASAYNVSPIKNINIDRVESIVDQNGVPVFYGGFIININYVDRFAGYSWDTGWNFKDLHNIGTPSEKYFSLDTVVYSDGDAYAVMNSANSHYGFYALLKEPYPYRSVERASSNEILMAGISGIVVIEDGMFPEGKVDSITAPVWREGDAVSLAVPPVDLSGGQTVTAQGWQTSEDGNDDWTEFTPPSTASMSLNGLYLRYYARGSSGITYYSNTVSIVVRGAVDNITAPVWGEGDAISLTPPQVDLSGVTAQGWQISDTGSGGWTNFTPPSTASMSHNGKYLRYYAASGGQTYYSNTVIISVRVNPPAITTTSLPSCTVGTAYSQTLTATGSAPITWNIQSGSLPAGLTLSASGVISGTPTVEGTSTFTVRAVNSAGNNTRQLSIAVTSSGGGMDSAIPLTENVWANGNIATVGGYQWFTFEATASTQYIHVELGTLNDLYVQVYASDGTAVESETNLFGSNGATRYTSRSLTVGQTYYIRVRPESGGFSGTYQIGFGAIAPPPGATPLTANQWANGNLPTNADVQWFSFNATAATQYIHVEPVTVPSLAVNVYESDGITVVGAEATNASSFSRALTVGQTYYIRVRPYSGSGSYRIAFSALPFSPGAIVVSLTEDVWANGNIEAAGGYQWFTFEATAATQYIYVAWGPTVLYVNVYESDGTTVVGTETGLGNTSLRTSRTLTVGQTYYIRVRIGDSSYSNTYQIGFNASTTSGPPVQFPSNAIPLTENQWANGNLPAANSQQWFVFTATASMQYIYVEFDTSTSMYMQVYNSNGTEVGYEAYLQSNGIRNTSQSLTSGQTYYIMVRPPRSGNGGTYRIAFNASTTAPTP